MCCLHDVVDVRAYQNEILSRTDNAATLSAGLSSAADN